MRSVIPYAALESVFYLFAAFWMKVNIPWSHVLFPLFLHGDTTLDMMKINGLSEITVRRYGFIFRLMTILIIVVFLTYSNGERELYGTLDVFTNIYGNCTFASYNCVLSNIILGARNTTCSPFHYLLDRCHLF